MLLETMRLPQGLTIEEAAVRSMQRAGFRLVNGSETTVNGLPAFVGSYSGSLRTLGRVEVSGAHIVHDREVFLAAGIAPIDEYPGLERTLAASLRSFRALSAGEAESIRPNRIDFYTARQDDTWQSIAERQGRGLAKAATVAIMNGHAVSDQPRPGERLKIVAGG
jgi:predicted Zn-dependent protease